MASYDPDFHGDGPNAAPPAYDAEPRGRGCLFYGCVTAVVLSVLLALGLALSALVAYRTMIKYRDMYTALQPMPLPKLALSEPEREQAVGRAKAFRDAVEAGKDVEPLTLTGDDLNALIQETPELKGRVYLDLEGDKIKAKVSIPLGEVWDTSLVQGRYLNGEAEAKLRLRNGALKLELLSMFVDGKPLPKPVRDAFSKSNIFLGDEDDDEKDEDEQEPDSEFEHRLKNFLRRVSSIEVKDGAMIVTPRAPSPPGEEAPPRQHEREDRAPATPPTAAPAPTTPSGPPSSPPSPAVVPAP